jgi:hypothetical protein
MKIPRPKIPPFTGLTRDAPPAPPFDYQDDVSQEQLEVLRNLVDPDGKRAKQRRLLCEPGW